MLHKNNKLKRILKEKKLQKKANKVEDNKKIVDSNEK